MLYSIIQPVKNYRKSAKVQFQLSHPVKLIFIVPKARKNLLKEYPNLKQYDLNIILAAKQYSGKNAFFTRQKIFDYLPTLSFYYNAYSYFLSRFNVIVGDSYFNPLGQRANVYQAQKWQCTIKCDYLLRRLSYHLNQLMEDA